MHNSLASFNRVGLLFAPDTSRGDQNIAIIVYKYYNLVMIIYQREPVFTIGQAPFVAGAIHVRNQIRILKRREKARRRKALVERIPLLRVTLPR
jgi:hypothetical protein